MSSKACDGALLDWERVVGSCQLHSRCSIKQTITGVTREQMRGTSLSATLQLCYSLSLKAVKTLIKVSSFPAFSGYVEADFALFTWNSFLFPRIELKLLAKLN